MKYLVTKEAGQPSTLYLGQCQVTQGKLDKSGSILNMYPPSTIIPRHRPLQRDMIFITVNTSCECFSLRLLSLLDISMGKLELIFFLIEELSIILLLSISVVIILIGINPLTKLVFDLRKKEWKSI